MKLSEKLAALEEQEQKVSSSTAKVHRARPAGKTRRKSASATGWDSSSAGLVVIAVSLIVLRHSVQRDTGRPQDAAAGN